MTQHGKKYKESLTKVDREALYGVAEAVDLVKQLASAKFDETVELAVRLGVDPRKADQIVRGTLSLPSGTGRTERVAVFAAGEAAAEARAAGADVVGADDLVAKVNGGFLDFDVAIATPDLMGQVGTLGRVLGPRGLMPNPKTGTVTTDVGQGGGRVQGRPGRVPHRQGGQRAHPRRQGLLHPRPAGDQHPRRGRRAPAGQAAPPPRAATSCRITVSTTMGPGVHIDPVKARFVRRGAGRPGLRPGTHPVGSTPAAVLRISRTARRLRANGALNPIRQRPPVHPRVPKRPARAGLTRRHREHAGRRPALVPSHAGDPGPHPGRSSPVEDTDGNAERTEDPQGRGRRRGQDAHRARRRPPSSASTAA